MVMNYGTRNGLNKGLSVDGEVIPSEVSSGVGAPVHSAPKGSIYVDLNATLGTASHFRNTTGASVWAAMSDD